jgi:hypothetical protein
MINKFKLMLNTLYNQIKSNVKFNSMKVLFTFIFLGIQISAQAQTTGSVGVGTTTPNANAVLDVTSTTKGLLIPRLTSAERTTLTSSLNTTSNGLLIYNTSTLKFNYWDGSQWKDISVVGESVNKLELTGITFAVPANSSLIQNFTFTGAALGNTVTFSPNSALPDGIIVSYARVSAANTIEVKFFNATGLSITIPAINYEVAVIK